MQKGRMGFPWAPFARLPPDLTHFGSPYIIGASSGVPLGVRQACMG